MWIKRVLGQTSFLRNFFSTKSIEAPKKYGETISKARAVMSLYALQPTYTGNVFIAPNATIVGQVFLGNHISIGHGTVIRGDINSVKLHANVIIGDNCVLHTAASLPNGLPAHLEIDNQIVVQAGCTLYSCHIKKNAFIGFNSVILQGAVIEEGAIVAPNSVVPPGRVVPGFQVWGGNPIKFIRYAKEQTAFVTKNIAQEIINNAEAYKYQFLPYNNAYLFKENNQEENNFRHWAHPQEQAKAIKSDQYNPDNPTI